jgi:hypothetical protein
MPNTYRLQDYTDDIIALLQQRVSWDIAGQHLEYRLVSLAKTILFIQNA